MFLEEVRFLNDEADDTEQEQRIVVLAEDSGRERKRKKSGSGKRPMEGFVYIGAKATSLSFAFTKNPI